MTDQEMMDSLPVTVKLVAPGIGKLQQDKKKNKKKERQNEAKAPKEED